LPHTFASQASFVHDAMTTQRGLGCACYMRIRSKPKPTEDGIDSSDQSISVGFGFDLTPSAKKKKGAV
ncbi:MAG TPA: hypothetical protein VNN25_07035, partial [Thermoanaerobaculia bacterium]|nr:hypothetical protein [Thermoanaerobaculia bacterium]